MRRTIAIVAALAVAATSARAQEKLSSALIGAVIEHLQNGGTYADGRELGRELLLAAQAAAPPAAPAPAAPQPQPLPAK
jgi:hypothetical protein